MGRKKNLISPVALRLPALGITAWICEEKSTGKREGSIKRSSRAKRYDHRKGQASADPYRRPVKRGERDRSNQKKKKKEGNDLTKDCREPSRRGFRTDEIRRVERVKFMQVVGEKNKSKKKPGRSIEQQSEPQLKGNRRKRK